MKSTNKSKVAIKAKPSSEYKPLKVLLIKASNIRSTVYQRDLDRPNIESIKSAFDINRLGVLKVALRDDGYYYLIDGQHRYVALVELCGDNIHITCEVVENSDAYIQSVVCKEKDDMKEITLAVTEHINNK